MAIPRCRSAPPVAVHVLQAIGGRSPRASRSRGRIEPADDPAHRERPVEVVRASESRRDPALSGRSRAAAGTRARRSSRGRRRASRRRSPRGASARRRDADRFVLAAISRPVVGSPGSSGGATGMSSGGANAPSDCPRRGRRRALDRRGKLVETDPIAHRGDRRRIASDTCAGFERRRLRCPFQGRCVQERPRDERDEEDHEHPTGGHQPAAVEGGGGGLRSIGRRPTSPCPRDSLTCSPSFRTGSR